MNLNTAQLLLRTLLLTLIFSGNLFVFEINQVVAQTTLSPVNDAYIRSGENSGINYGDDTELRIKATDNANNNRKTILQFDLSEIDVVSQAVLRLYVSQTKTVDISVYAITDDWNESTVTWDSIPTESSSIATSSVSNEGVYCEWDVSDLVAAEAEGDKFISFLLADADMNATTVVFNSKEASSNTPQLVITGETESYTSIPVTEDAKVYYWGTSKYLNNYGNEDDLAVKHHTTVKYCIDSYLKFDISSITEARKKVLLQLYVDSLSRTTSVSLYKIDANDDWSESTISGDDKPVASQRIGVYPISGIEETTFDISEAFNEALANNQDEFTLVVKENEGAYVGFSSKDASGNPPQLLIGEETTTYSEPTVYTGTYYIDNELGDDSNDGSSEDTPWQNISKLQDITFGAGTIIKLKRGCVWEQQQLFFNGSGADSNPITIEAYGTGDKPALNGGGAVNYVIQLFNQEYIEISNLYISNEGSEKGGILKGISVIADNFGELNHLHFTNIDFADITGTDGEGSGVYDNSDDSKQAGGLLFHIRGDDVQTYFDDVLVDQCSFLNCSNTGTSNTSHWTSLNFDSDWDDNGEGTSSSDYVHNFVPSKNMVFSRNRFENIYAQGIIIRTAEDPIMEYNLFYYCSIGEGSNNACFNSKTTGAIWRYNESCFTQWQTGQGDGAGIDSDIRTKNTLIEYNYCHDNEYGGVITTGGRFSTSFNDSTIIRYNVLANNGHNSVRLCNNNTNAIIFNNLVYYDMADTNRLVFQHLHGDTPSGPTDTRVTNNIFYAEQNNGRFIADVDWTDSRVERCNYSNNLYYGIVADDQYPDDDNKVVADPLFSDDYLPDSDIGGYVLLDDDGIPTGELSPAFLNMFNLQEESPAIDAGDVNEYTFIPEFDFKNDNSVSGSAIDIGPFEYVQSDDVTGIIDTENNAWISIYPNPANSYVVLNSSATLEQVTISSLQGKKIKEYDNISRYRLTIQLDGLHAGVYIVKAISSNGLLQMVKLIVE